MLKNSYKDKKVLVFGLGLNQGGVGAAKFFVSLGAKVRVTDLKTADILQSSLEELKSFSSIEYTLGQHKNEDIDWADLIIKNPAVKPGNPYIDYALKKGKSVEQDMGIFLRFVEPSQIIGVTGTKGKSTSASLIYEIMIKNTIAQNVIFAGNIGKSVLDTIGYIDKNSLVILELSSFQLEAFDQHKVSPKWALITNIYPDHLNYYQNMDEYIRAKRVIGKYQTPDDFLFINKDNTIINNPKFMAGFKGQVNFYSSKDLPKDFHPRLEGMHNLSNIAAAYALGKVFGINSNLLFESLSQFKGIPFRMELVREWNGVKIYNDTAATTPDAGIKALQTLPNCLLIAGGMNKNMSYEEYAKTVDKLVKKVFFLEGDSTEEIKSLMANQNLIAGTYNNFEQLLQDVKNQVQPKDVILFSPAATSFNLFQNEFDRGRQFNRAVEKVFGKGIS